MADIAVLIAERQVEMVPLAQLVVCWPRLTRWQPASFPSRSQAWRSPIHDRLIRRLSMY